MSGRAPVAGRGGRRRGGRRNTEGRTWGAVAGWALLGTLPVACVQVTLAWFSMIFASHRAHPARSHALPLQGRTPRYCIRDECDPGLHTACW